MAYLCLSFRGGAGEAHRLGGDVAALVKCNLAATQVFVSCFCGYARLSMAACGSYSRMLSCLFCSFDTLVSPEGHKAAMNKKRDDYGGGGGGGGGRFGRGSRITGVDRIQGGSGSECW